MVTDDERREAMARAMSGFAAVVATIEPGEWNLPSPCVGWSVFDVVDHVVAGDRFAARILTGVSLDDAIEGLFGLERGRTDAVAQVEEAASIAMAGFALPLDVVVDHPVGLIPARRFLGFRIIDQLGHTWDLSAALDRGVELDPASLALGVEIAHAELEELQTSTHFATAPGDLVESADPLTTFLNAIGRRPRG